MAKKRKQYWSHIIKELDNKLPINVYAAKAFPILGSKSSANKAISGGRLFYNGQPAQITDWVQVGDHLELRGSGIKNIKKVDIDVDIVYEDDFVIVVNKPAGIAVNGNANVTIENAVARHNMNNHQPDALPHPVAIHRIDVPTTGIVLLAKTKKALIQLGRAFEKNQIKKEYIAVVHGQVEESGRVEFPIKDKKAVTDFKTELVVPSMIFEHLSLVNLFPVTGRTHQLRIHMKELGHLIVGDKMYSKGQKTILGKGLLLCARRISFRHPETGETMNLQVHYPEKFRKVMQREKVRAKNKKTDKRKKRRY